MRTLGTSRAKEFPTLSAYPAQARKSGAKSEEKQAARTKVVPRRGVNLPSKLKGINFPTCGSPSMAF
jgi:hypothetical protein